MKKVNCELKIAAELFDFSFMRMFLEIKRESYIYL